MKMEISILAEDETRKQEINKVYDSVQRALCKLGNKYGNEKDGKILTLLLLTSILEISVELLDEAEIKGLLEVHDII